MSFEFNYKFWVATKKEIEQLHKRQNVLKRMDPVGDKLLNFKIFSELYVLYAELVNKLGYVYHNTFQVQKRKVVRPLMEAATRRLIELKEELKGLELNEYVYVDRTLIARKLTPYNMMIWRSPQFLYQRPPDIQNIIYENQLYMREEFMAERERKEHIKIAEGILLIQTHERARRARVYKSSIKYDKKNLVVRMPKVVRYKFTHKSDQLMSIPVKRTIFSSDFIKQDENCKHLLESDNLQKDDEIDPVELERQRNEAALVIQCAWRSYKSRKHYRIRKDFKLELFGMKTKRKLLRPDLYRESILESYRKEILKRKLDQEFVDLIKNERTRLLQQRAPWIMEDISDHIRGWFFEFYDKLETFHPFPDPVKGGTVLVLLDETMTLLEYLDVLNKKPKSKEELKKEADKLKAKIAKDKARIKKKKLRDAARRKKMRSFGIYDIGWMISSNKHIDIMETTLKKYNEDWQMIDEYLNKNHDPHTEWVTEAELAIIHKELRALVDEYMRVEYELLRKALCQDKKKKYRPTKYKKPKKKKEKRKRKTKDMTKDRTLQSLYDELKDAGVIQTYKDISFDAFVSDFNYLADSTRDADNLTTVGPAKGDIKMVIQECILGMGEFSIEKPKAICLVGPPYSGKKLLSNIIARELDAIIINLSPEITSQNKEIFQNMNYFMHVVMKVAKNFQPAIIYIENAHRVFWKKIPPDQVDLNPRFLMKVFKKKLIKPIKKDDKVMVVGTSDMPWSAKKAFKKVFPKVLLIPKSDYGTCYLLWMELMDQHAEGQLQDYECSALSKVLLPYTSGDICNNVVETLDVERRMRLKSSPLLPSEFLEHFIGNGETHFPPEAKIFDKYQKFWNKSNKMAKARRKFIKDKEKRKKKK